jgi:subtilase family serine protease
MQRRIAIRTATSVAAVSALALGCLVAAPGAGAQVTRKAVPNTKPTWLAHATHVGAASKSAAMHLRVYLSPTGGLGNLKAAATAVSTPGSSTYRHFITSSAYQKLYAPTDATVSKVKSWLKASGLTVTGVEAARRYISVAGTVAAAQKAFGVSL